MKNLWIRLLAIIILSPISAIMEWVLLKYGIPFSKTFIIVVIINIFMAYIVLTILERLNENYKKVKFE